MTSKRDARQTKGETLQELETVLQLSLLGTTACGILRADSQASSVRSQKLRTR